MGWGRRTNTKNDVVVTIRTAGVVSIVVERTAPQDAPVTALFIFAAIPRNIRIFREKCMRPFPDITTMSAQPYGESPSIGSGKACGTVKVCLPHCITELQIRNHLTFFEQVFLMWLIINLFGTLIIIR